MSMYKEEKPTEYEALLERVERLEKSHDDLKSDIGVLNDNIQSFLELVQERLRTQVKKLPRSHDVQLPPHSNGMY